MNKILEKITEQTWLQWLLIVIITTSIFAKSLSYGILYNYDDDSYFNDYRISHLNADNAGQYFSDYYLGMYQPLPVLSFAVINDLLPGSVPAQRIVNLLFHFANTLLVIVLVRKLTGKPGIAGLTGLVFAIHPMHVESVAWISTRSNLMYACFYLLALIFYLRWIEQKRGKIPWLMLLLFTLALFSKVNAATLPLVIGLIDWYKNRKLKSYDWITYALMLALAGVFIYVGVQASGAFGHIQELSSEYTISDRVFVITNALWLYLWKAFMPVNQSVIYLYPWLQSGHLPWFYYITGILTISLFVITIFLGIRYWKKNGNKDLLFGIALFLFTISIVLPLKWSRTIIIAERYTYLPYIGLTLAVLLVAAHYYQSWKKPLRQLVAALGIVVMLFFMMKSYARTKVWENAGTLFTDVTENGRSNAEKSMGYYNLGNEKLRIGDIESAQEHYSKAIQLQPSYFEAYFNRGLSHLYRKEFDLSVEDFSKVIRLKPSYDEGYIERAISYRALGKFQQALDDFNHVLEQHANGSAYYNRGVLLYFNLNSPEQGCSDWENALKLGVPQAKQMIETYCNFNQQ